MAIHIGGNICIDEENNIYFLDMGLLSILNNEDLEFCRKFFLASYCRDYEKIYNLVVCYSNMDEKQKNLFKQDCKKYCEELKEKELTYYFIDMVNICTKYEILPPDFLFNMAKAFVCLNGINKYCGNKFTATELVQEQTMEFLINRSLNDCKNLAVSGIELTPKAFENILNYGVVNTIAKISTGKFNKDIKVSLEDLKETIEIIKMSYFSDVIS